MTAPEYSKLAARALTRFDRDPPPPSIADRARAIGAIEGALRAKSQRKARGRLAARVMAATALAASVGAIGIGVHALRARPTAVASTAPAAPRVDAVEMAPMPARVIAHTSGDGASVVGAGSAPLVDGEALAPGSRIVARPAGHAILAFATGTRLTVEDGGDVTLVDGGPQSIIAVARGALRADVAKLHAGERFLVRTSDTEVEVRGTSFRVTAEAAPCAGTSTRVAVYEGTVVVRHGGGESRVEAGETWPKGCGGVAAGASRTRGASPGSTPPSSTLAEQNDLFASAVAAKQAGDTSLAVERFDAFVRKYPASPLAENAAAERVRLLRGVDPARAQAAARAYLARWPEGFARSEAQAVLER